MEKGVLVVAPLEGCTFHEKAGERIMRAAKVERVIQSDGRMTIEGPETTINSLKCRFTELGLRILED